MEEQTMEKTDSTSARSDESASFFSSARERRLWLFTLVAVVGIYSTLALSSTLSKIDQNLAAAGFLSFMLAVAVTVVLLALKVRPRGAEIGVALGIASVYLFLFLRMTIPERSHLIEYSVVAAFIYAALIERKNNGRRVPIPALLAILFTTLIGAFDEFIQIFLPSRVFDPVDIFFNFLASIMAVTASVILIWVRKKITK